MFTFDFSVRSLCRVSTFAFTFCLAHVAGILNAQDATTVQPAAREKIRVLLVDGQNNHGIWPKTSEMMRAYLIETGLFSVEIARTAPKGIDEEFAPDFSKFDVVLSNYNGESWKKSTQEAFQNFVADGGGLVIIHAADNAFPDWPEYNRMIGLGGWGNRNEANGPYVYFDSKNQMQRDQSAGSGGSHGNQHEFVIELRQPEHPVMRGMPVRWLHAQDELYDRLRGPGENLEVLATAFAAKEQGGSDRHEPMVMTVTYGQGRVFHTTLGHADYSQACVGFVTLLQRGTEWAATGNVTQSLPEDFPSETKSISRPPKTAALIRKIELGKTINASELGFIVFAGAIDSTDAELFRTKGIRTIISLRKTDEIDWDESAWAAREGFRMIHLPCSSPKDLSADQLQVLFDTLNNASPDQQVLFHCGSAGRVGVCWALFRTTQKGAAVSDALQEAAAIGPMNEKLKSDVLSMMSGGK